MTQADANEDDLGSSLTLSASGEKEEIDEELGTMLCSSSNSEVSSDSNVSSSGDDGHNRQESNISSSVHQVSFMIRLPSVKIITVRFNLFETTIGGVKSEIQNQFGLCPSQYILKLGYKKLANDNCSLADYNIQERNTLDVVLRAISSLPAGGTDANDDERDPLYDWSTNSPDEIDERLKKKISELDDKHGLHLQERSNEELKYVLRDKPEADRKHVMRDFKVQSSITQNKTRRRFTCDELITNFLDQKREDFPRLRRSLMTRAEREADTRAKRSETKKQADNAKVAKHNAQVRAEERAQIEHNWPTLDIPGWQVPGKHYSVENHTNNPVAAVYLSHVV